MTARQPPAARVRAGRRNLYIIFGAIVAVIAASTLLYRLSSLGVIDLPELLGTRNQGTLISPPRAVGELALTRADGTEFEYHEGPARWSVLLPFALPCDELCQHHLYLTRQVRIALGREMQLLRRLLVLPEDALAEPGFMEWLREEHPGLQVLRAPPPVFAELEELAPPTAAGDGWVLTDPQGWMMMYYSSEQSGNAVLSDLKFLVRHAHGQ